MYGADKISIPFDYETIQGNTESNCSIPHSLFNTDVRNTSFHVRINQSVTLSKIDKKGYNNKDSKLINQWSSL